MNQTDNNRVKLYMRFEKKLPSAQGMDIWQDRAYILYDTGYCGVYDLISREAEPLAFFPLGSCNEGTPDRNYLNHANSCMFSQIHLNNNPIPLLYVTIGNGIGKDEDGFYWRCSVENIVRTVDEEGKESFRAEVIHTITYRPEPMEGVYEQPSWGCPAFFVDSDAGWFYIFSARYRTTRGNVPPNQKNTYITTKFALPDIQRTGMIRLGPEDIVDQFTVESDVMFTQGGTLADNKIFYTFGCPERGYSIHVMVFDLIKKSLIAQVDDLDEEFNHEEIECCAIYQNTLLCNTCDGSIFSLDSVY